MYWCIFVSLGFRSVLSQLPTLWKVFLAPISTSQCLIQISHSRVFHPCHLLNGPCLIRKFILPHLNHTRPPVDILSFLQWIQTLMLVRKKNKATLVFAWKRSVLLVLPLLYKNLYNSCLLHRCWQFNFRGDRCWSCWKTLFEVLRGVEKGQH